MPQTSDSAIPRSPRYSRAHVSKANTCESRSRGPSAWHACRYSCAIVPSGVRPCSMREQDVAGAGELLRRTSRFSVRSTSSCQAREKRRRVP